MDTDPFDIDTSSFTGTFTDVPSARRALAAAVALSNRGLVNLVSPAHDVAYLPPMHALSISLVDPRNFALYGFTQNPKPGEPMGIPKQFLDALLQHRRISTVSTRRTDDGTLDDYWQWEVVLQVPDLSGGVRLVHKMKEVDLRDGTPGAEKAMGASKSIPALNGARIHGPAMAESKAQNRAAREALGITGMAPSAFRRWWVVAALVPNVDLSQVSQDARDRIAEAMVLGPTMGALYGRSRPAATPQQESENGPLASEDQRRRLSAACDRLGDRAFFDKAALALGYDCPAPAEVTAAEAKTILTALNTKAPF